MARAKRINYDEQLKKVEEQIAKKTEELIILQKEKEVILANKEDFEIEKLRITLREKGIPISSAIDAIVNEIFDKKVNKK